MTKYLISVNLIYNLLKFFPLSDKEHFYIEFDDVEDCKEKLDKLLEMDDGAEAGYFDLLIDCENNNIINLKYPLSEENKIILDVLYKYMQEKFEFNLETNSIKWNDIVAKSPYKNHLTVYAQHLENKRR